MKAAGTIQTVLAKIRGLWRLSDQRQCPGTRSTGCRWSLVILVGKVVLVACVLLVVGLPIYVQITGSKLTYNPEPEFPTKPLVTVRTSSAPVWEDLSNRVVFPK